MDFTPHPDAKNYERSDKVVYYQINPQAHWGPASRAKNVPATVVSKADKRKGAEDEEEVASKKVKVAEIAEEEGINT